MGRVKPMVVASKARSYGPMGAIKTADEVRQRGGTVAVIIVSGEFRLDEPPFFGQCPSAR